MEPYYLQNMLIHIFKDSTSLDVKSGRFNCYILALKCSTLSLLLFSTLSCMPKDEENTQDFYPIYHDLLVVLMLLLFQTCLIVIKPQVCALIALLVEPLEEVEPNSVRSQVVYNFSTEFTKCMKGAIALYVFFVPTLSAAPLLLWLFDQSNMVRGCIRLGAFGWLQSLDSYWFDLLIHIFSMVICMWVIFDIVLWLILIFYAVLKVKYTIRLICIDLTDMDKMNNWSDEISSEGTKCSSVYWAEGSMIRTAPGLQVKVEGQPETVERKNDVSFSDNEVSLDVLNNSKEQMRKELVKLFLQNIVEKHLKIIQLVKLTDKTTRLYMVIMCQLEMITFALAVPKVTSGSNLMSVNYIGQGAELIGAMLFFCLICYIGQILLDESETLRQALYNCDWTDKPQSLRRGLLIMQIVATKPLRLTVGGIYTLGLETYANMVNATYSYISLLQSLN